MLRHAQPQLRHTTDNTNERSDDADDVPCVSQRKDSKPRNSLRQWDQPYQIFRLPEGKSIHNVSRWDLVQDDRRVSDATRIRCRQRLTFMIS